MTPPIHFDKARRQYVDAHGKIVPAAEIRKEIDTYIKSEQSLVNAKTKELLAGTVTIAVFFSWMQTKVRGWHHVAGVIAYGGEDQMTPKKWERIGQKVQSELNYLAGFEADVVKSARATEHIANAVEVAVKRSPLVPDGLETVARQRVEQAMFAASPSTAKAEIQQAVESAVADSIGTEEAISVSKTIADEIVAPWEDLIWGQINSRAQKYPSSVYATHENSVKAREGDLGATLVQRVCLDDSASCEDCPLLATDDFVPLGEVTDIGAGCQCQVNCRCEFIFSYHGIEPLSIDREIYA